MERRALGVVAIILIGLMAIVATAGLDKLPPSLKKSVGAAGSLLAQDRSAFDENRKQIETALRDEPVLFQHEAGSWEARLDGDRAQLETAATKLATVEQLASQNRRTDAYYVETGLGEVQSLRQSVLRDAAGIRAEADRWLGSKRALPARLQAMQASYNALEAVDADSASVRKAMTDWPAKRDDLQTRWNGIQELKAQGRQLWESSAPLRAAAAADKLADTDYETLFAQADKLDAAATQSKTNMAETVALASQLYAAWDKLLLDDDTVRTVTTRFPDATLQHGETTSDESKQTARDGECCPGMVVEHKSAGQYDTEPERSAQPPAYVYMAPPGQANNYGSWSGGVWHWLPEYLILSQLLRSQRTITAPDFEAYQSSRQRGEVYYGRNNEYSPRWSSSAPSAPSYSRPPPSASNNSSPSTGWYQERGPATRPVPQVAQQAERGYAGSKYQSRGTYNGSRYQSRGTFGSSQAGSSGARSYSRSRGGRR